MLDLLAISLPLVTIGQTNPEQAGLNFKRISHVDSQTRLPELSEKELEVYINKWQMKKRM
jgi:hypothetical protein